MEVILRKGKSFPFMWSEVEAFQIWENTVINLQPPRIMWCYKWRQLQTLFLQEEWGLGSPTLNLALPELISVGCLLYQLPEQNWAALAAGLPGYCCTQCIFFIVTLGSLWTGIAYVVINICDFQTQRLHRSGWQLVGSRIPSYSWQPSWIQERNWYYSQSDLCVLWLQRSHSDASVWLLLLPSHWCGT